MKSIIQSDRSHCFLCGKNAHADYFGLDEHHCFFGPYRKKAEQYGLKVFLCHDKCHLNGVHKSAEIDRAIKRVAQKVAMRKYGWTVDEFRAIFGRNYIDEVSKSE